MVELVPRSQNPDDRPLSTYDSDPSPYDNPALLRAMRLNEELEKSELARIGPMKASPSEFVSGALRIPSKGKLANFSFRGREYLRAVYDCSARRRILMAGRQVEKSTLLGNTTLAYSQINPYFRVLYVSPSNQQTKVFSRDRIAEPIELSEFLKQTTNNKLLKNVLEKKFVNHSQITLRFAFLNADRCLAGDSLVQLADGSLVPIQELVGREVDVVAATYDGRPQLARATNVRRTGTRSLIQVRTSYPVPLRCTPDHRLLTGRGWVEAQDLRENDYIAAPHPQHLFSEKSIGEDTAWLLGALVSEGECVARGSLRFSNTDEDFVLEFEQRATALGLGVGQRVLDTRYENICYSVSLYSDSRGPGLNGAKAKLWELGEFGAGAAEKHVPSCIFKATLSEKASFLQSLFRGDGWCVEESGYGRAGYCTASKRLAEDVVHLLWALGIRTSIRPRPPSTPGAVGSFIVDMSTSDTARLVALAGEYRDGLAYKLAAGKSVKDRLPFSYEWLRSYLRETYGLSTHSAWTRHHIQLRPGNRRDSIGRRVLQDIAAKLKDDYLKTLADPSTSWVEVVDVTPDGKEDVYDLTVDGLECFQANGLIVHNCRGIPADLVVIDEFQDILLDNVPVIEECASHSDFKYFIYAGTPKSLDNSIEYYWTRFSTQNEWSVPCKRHGTPKKPSSWHWNVLDEENIGEKFLICNQCGEQIRPDDPDARWVALNPHPNVEKPFEGFRIPQLMVPWIEWSDILNKQRVYSRAKFHNEVLGRSYDAGTRPLTRRDVQRNCWDELSMRYYREVMQYASTYPIFMGIDWGSAESSYTVVTLGGYLPFAPDRYTVFYWHRFEGVESEPRKQLEIIRKLAVDFHVQKIGVDYGGGHWPNDELTRDFGADKVKKYQWVGNVKKKIKFDPQLGIPRHLCHRTEVMSDMFNAIKRGNVFWFPRWDEFEDPYAADMLNIYSEFNERLRMNVYKAAPSHPDDSFHSLTFGFLASFYVRPRPDVILPTKEIQRQQGLMGTEEEDDPEELDVV